jgi:hypothetical protein
MKGMEVPMKTTKESLYDEFKGYTKEFTALRFHWWFSVNR